MSGKRQNSTIDQKWEDNYLYNGQISSSRCIKIVIIIPAAFCFQHRDQRSSLQVVAVDWIFSFRIKCVGLEPIFGSYDVTENRAVLNILEGQ